MNKNNKLSIATAVLAAVALTIGIIAFAQAQNALNPAQARGTRYLGQASALDLTIDDTLNIDDTAYTAAGGQTLDPIASHYLLAPSSALTLTLATTTAVTGDFVWFVSNVTTATVVVDTGATAGGGNRTLGENDVIGFIYDGAAWLEAFYSDNS